MTNRRTFMRSAAAAAACRCAEAKSPALPKLEQIIDTHAHFYDPSRPEGVPWPPKDDAILYRTVLPAEYRKMTAPLGVTGVIEVEASPLLEDNQWILDLAAREPIIVGTSGDIEAGKPGFGKSLERFHKNPRFLGIRISGLWGRNLHADIGRPEFIADLKLLAQAGLEADVGSNANSLGEVVQISDKVPDLRLVINHMPYNPPMAEPALSAYRQAMREIGKRPLVYCKVSSVLRRVNDRPVEDANYYRPSLDELWGLFGPDRLIYGSNWPVSNKVGPYELVFKVVREYFATKGREASEKYFWKNSQAAYRWKARHA